MKETVARFEMLQQRNLIRHWGVSNFDIEDMRELVAVPGGAACSVNQVWCSLTQRGVEQQLLPWMRLYQMPLMAYSPLDVGGLLRQPEMLAMARTLEIGSAPLALAWLLAQPNVMPYRRPPAPCICVRTWRRTTCASLLNTLHNWIKSFPQPRETNPC